MTINQEDVNNMIDFLVKVAVDTGEHARNERRKRENDALWETIMKQIATWEEEATDLDGMRRYFTVFDKGGYHA